MADKFNQQEEYEAFKKLKQEQPKFLRGISGLWDGISASIKDAGDGAEHIAKQNKTFLGLSKSVLSNTKDIHKETVEWKDLSDSIVEAQRTGNKHLINQYKQMQKIQGAQKRYNNLVNAGANSIQKMTSSIDSSLRDIPIIGNFLADAINFDDIGKSLIDGFRSTMAPGGPVGDSLAKTIGMSTFQGVIEGTSSGLVESKITKSAIQQTQGQWEQVGASRGKGFFAGFKNAAKSVWAFFTGRKFGGPQEELNFNTTNAAMADAKKGTWPGLKEMHENLGKEGDIQGKINKKLAARRILTTFLGTAAALWVAKAAAFAFQTGLGLGNMLKMGPAILINKKYVEAMAEEFGTINDVNWKTAKALKIQEFRYGIQSDQAVKILRIQTAISDKTNDQLIAIQKSVAQEARLAGVLPAKLFEDIAQNMEYFAKTAKEGGENVMMTALAAKKLGLNLGVVDQIATHLLDIEGSIAAQFEASAVLGKELNLDRARQLSLLGKDAEMMDEVLRLVGGEASFNKMNRIERDLLSKAIGTDITNVAKMVTEEERATKAVAKQKNQWIAIGGIVLGIIGALVGIIPGFGQIAWGKMAAGAVIGAGIGMGIGSAVGSKLPSFQGLPPGVGAKIQTGGAMAHGGETIVRTESINMDGLLTEIKGLRQDLNKGQGRIYRGLEELG